MYTTQKLYKKSPSAHHRTPLLGYVFATKAHIDNGKIVKQQYLFRMSPQYRFGSLGHPSKFQRISRVGSVTALTSLSGGQSNFAQCLAVSWPGTLYIHFRDLLPLTEFCHVQNSLCVHLCTIAQVSRAISSQLRHLSIIGKKTC